MKNQFIAFRLLLIILISFGCGGDQKLKKKEYLIFKWEKTSETNYMLTANDLPIGKLNIFENWIFFNDVQKNNTHKMIATNESMSPLSISWPEFKKYKINLNSIVFQQFENCCSLQFKMHFYINEKVIDPAYLDTIIFISQNRTNEFYHYQIKSSLILGPTIIEDFFRQHKTLEYQDVLIDGLVTFMPALSNKWKWLIYKNEENFFKLPLHHHNIYNDLHLKTESEICFSFEEKNEIGNPSFQFDKFTSNLSYFILCTWAFDLHFYVDLNLALNEARKNRPIEVNYSISYKTKEELSNDFNTAKISPMVELAGFKAPVYEFNHKNEFEPSDLYKEPNDHYFWYSFSDVEFCEWDVTQGYNSLASLKIINNSLRISSWKFFALTSSHLPDFSLNGKYKISSMIKAKNAKGFIKIGWLDSNITNINYSIFEIDGDLDWESIHLITQDTTGAQSGGILLEFEGLGEVWFDNVYFENIEKLDFSMKNQ